MTRRRPQNTLPFTPATRGAPPKTGRRAKPSSSGRALAFLACAASLLFLAPAFGATGGKMPSERQTGAAQPQESQPDQTIDEGSNEESTDTASDYERLPLPVNRKLTGGAVRLYADSAHIVIRWDADPNPPHVRAQWSLEGPSGNLLLSSGPGDSVLRHVADPTIDGYPVIELHLAPNQGVAVFGSSLSVDALEAGNDDTRNPGDPPVSPPTSQLEIEVERSDLTLTNIPFLRVKGEETVLFATGGIGPWTIDVRGGSSELADHRGTIHFTGYNTEAGFEDLQGVLNVDISDSTVFIRGGKAIVEATTSGGSIECDETTGILTISGASTSVTLRRVHASRLTVTGDDLYVTVESGRGRARVTLTRGNLSVSSWATRIDLGARDGAIATIRDLDGDIAFDATDGASVGIFGVTGHVRGRVRGASIDVSSLKSIQLQAKDSEITVEKTRNLTAFELTDSTAYLNLHDLRGTPEISLNGSSRADIELHYPCQVRVEGPGAKNAGRISVNGCENLRPGQDWAKARVQRRGAKPVETIHLTVTMGQRANLSVRGY